MTDPTIPWCVGMIVSHRLGRFRIIFVDEHDSGEPQLSAERVSNPADSFKDYAFMFTPEAKPDAGAEP